MNPDPQTSPYEDLISTLVNGLAQRALFHRDHPRVQGAARDFVRGLRQRLAADQREAFFLGVVEGRLVHDGRFLFGSTLLGRKLVGVAEKLRCGGFLFRAAIGDNDVLALFDFCVELRDVVASLDEARERLKQRTQAIELSPLYEDQGWFGQFHYSKTEVWDGAGTPKQERVMVPVFQSLFEAVETAHGKAAADHALDVDNARSVSEGLLHSLETTDAHDLLRGVRYPSYDSYTVGHSVRVALLAVLVARELRAPTRYVIELCTAGLLHDVGKSKIPNEILFKPGVLDDEERRVISQHPRLGAELLLANHSAGPLSIGAAFGHHIRHDGGGYPAVPCWHAVGKATALLHVCDVFEALTAVRPYKPALTPRRAFEIMLADRGAFHPGAFQALVRCTGLYPPGSRVLLSSGERALVLTSGQDIERPTVRITHARNGATLPENEAHDLDLATANAIKILRLLDDPAPPTAAEASIVQC